MTRAQLLNTFMYKGLNDKSADDVSTVCTDTIEEIAMHLTLNELYRFLLTCRRFSSSLSDRVWNNLCFVLYPEEFWEKAMKRPVSISRPLSSSKKELERLKNFEALIMRDGVVWTIQDYYRMWECQTSPCTTA